MTKNKHCQSPLSFRDPAWAWALGGGMSLSGRSALWVEKKIFDAFELWRLLFGVERKFGKISSLLLV